MTTTLVQPSYKLALASAVPLVGLVSEILKDAERFKYLQSPYLSTTNPAEDNNVVI